MAFMVRRLLVTAVASSDDPDDMTNILARNYKQARQDPAVQYVQVEYSTSQSPEGVVNYSALLLGYGGIGHAD